MDAVVSIQSPWAVDGLSEEKRVEAANALEAGSVLYLPRLAFELTAAEKALLTPTVANGKAKNISYNPNRDRVAGSSLDGAGLEELRRMMIRFGDWAGTLLRAVVPGYGPHLQQARTSFRPVEIRGRASSPMKDDTRLHVDAFPASPNHGRRILRVFSNINPHGEPRFWEIGQPFEEVASRFLPKIPAPVPGSAALLHWLHLTKQRRSPYDHLMLQLHDRGKRDEVYQRQSPRVPFEFMPGSTWIVYTDVTTHAALRGQFALEQTFHLDVEDMLQPERSPLRILERLTGRRLAPVGAGR